MPKKSKAPAPPITILDVAAPSLDARLENIYTSVLKLTEKKWDLPDAIAIPGRHPQAFARRVYSTGLASLDLVLGIGGIPRGHITELFGSPHAGKSLLVYQLIASVQHTCTRCSTYLNYQDVPGQTYSIALLVKGQSQTLEVPKRTTICSQCGALDSGGLFVLFDQEGTFDPTWVQAQGVELTKMIVLRLPTGEQAIDLLRMVMTNHKPDGIAIDSIAQLQPAAEAERSAVDDAQMIGLHAKIMAQLCRHVTASFLEDPKAAPLFLWVNQTRADVSGRGAIKVTGGHAPEFYSSIRIYLQRQQQVNIKKPALGTHGRMTIKKCKAAKGVNNQTLDYVITPEGFDRILDLYETALRTNTFLEKSLATGQHFYADDLEKTTLLARSKDDMIATLASDPALVIQIQDRLVTHTLSEQVPADIYVGDLAEGA